MAHFPDPHSVPTKPLASLEKYRREAFEHIFHDTLWKTYTTIKTIRIAFTILMISGATFSAFLLSKWGGYSFTFSEMAIQIPFWITLTASLSALALFAIGKALSIQMTLRQEKQKAAFQLIERQLSQIQSNLERTVSLSEEERLLLASTYQQETNRRQEKILQEAREKGKDKKLIALEKVDAHFQDIETIIPNALVTINGNETAAYRDAEFLIQEACQRRRERLSNSHEFFTLNNQLKTAQERLAKLSAKKCFCNTLRERAVADISLALDQLTTEALTRTKGIIPYAPSSSTKTEQRSVTQFLTDGFHIQTTEKDGSSHSILLHAPLLKSRWGHNPFVEHSCTLPFTKKQLEPLLSWTYNLSLNFQDFSIAELFSMSHFAHALKIESLSSEIRKAIHSRLMALPFLVGEAILLYFRYAPIDDASQSDDPMEHLLLTLFAFYASAKDPSLLGLHSWQDKKRLQLFTILNRKNENPYYRLALGCGYLLNLWNSQNASRSALEHFAFASNSRLNLPLAHCFYYQQLTAHYYHNQEERVRVFAKVEAAASQGVAMALYIRGKSKSCFQDILSAAERSYPDALFEAALEYEKRGNHQEAVNIIVKAANLNHTKASIAYADKILGSDSNETFLAYFVASCSGHYLPRMGLASFFGKLKTCNGCPENPYVALAIYEQMTSSEEYRLQATAAIQRIRQKLEERE